MMSSYRLTTTIRSRVFMMRTIFASFAEAVFALACRIAGVKVLKKPSVIRLHKWPGIETE